MLINYCIKIFDINGPFSGTAINAAASPAGVNSKFNLKSPRRDWFIVRPFQIIRVKLWALGQWLVALMDVLEQE